MVEYQIQWDRCLMPLGFRLWHTSIEQRPVLTHRDEPFKILFRYFHTASCYVRSMHQSSNSLYFGISVLLVWWSRHAVRARLAFGLQQQACEASSSMNETERYYCVSLESHCRLCRNRVVFKLNKMFVQRRLIGHCVHNIYSSFFLWPCAMSVRGHW